VGDIGPGVNSGTEEHYLLGCETAYVVTSVSKVYIALNLWITSTANMEAKCFSEMLIPTRQIT
jgi:hypothetical protein